MDYENLELSRFSIPTIIINSCYFFYIYLQAAKTTKELINKDLFIYACIFQTLKDWKTIFKKFELHYICICEIEKLNSTEKYKQITAGLFVLLLFFSLYFIDFLVIL